MRLSKLTLMFVLLCSTSACSVKFAYNNVDRLVRWQISDYLDLNAEQKEFVQTELDSFMSWHRREHLPQYAEYVNGLAVQYSDGVSEVQLSSLFEQFLVWGEEIEAEGMPAVIQLLASLTDEQVERLPGKLSKDNAEFVEDEIDVPLAKIQADWAQQFEDGLERFTGRLTAPQRKYIRDQAQSYQPERVMWMEYRQRWQADLLILLRDKRSSEEFGSAFQALVDAREDYYSEAFKLAGDANVDLSRTVASHILSNLSDKQAQRFQDALLKLAEDFSELSQVEQT